MRRPADFLAVIPYLVGFHPDESVVAVFSHRGRVLLTARVDLPPPQQAAELADSFAVISARHQVDEVVLVVYGAVAADARAVLERLVGSVGAPIREAVLVVGGRWWSLTCRSGCCPPEGTPYEPASHPLAAEAVYAGLSAQPSRVELQRQVGGPDEVDEVRLVAAAATVQQQTAGQDRGVRAALMAATVQRYLESDEPPDDDDCLLLAVLAADIAVRDVAWAMVTREDADDHLRVWSRTVARTPQDLARGPLGLLGVTAWIAGQGALQNCCAERLHELDPGYTLGRLLNDISERALPPRSWDDMADDMQEEVSAVAGLQRLH